MSPENLQNGIVFSNLLKQYMQELIKQSYSNSTISAHVKTLKMIYVDGDRFSNSDYHSERTKAWLEEQQKREKQGEISHRDFVFMRTAIARFEQFCRDGYLKVARCYERPRSLTEAFRLTHQEFLNSLPQNLAAATVQLHETNSRQFFEFIEERGIFDLKAITYGTIEDFLSCAYTHHERSMEKVTQALKLLFSYLHNNNLLNYIPDFSIMKPACRRSPVLPRFTYDEVKVLLSTIDRTTTIGKRDYAIVMTAIYTGLRLHDITDLKLKDIDWQKHEIRIIQNKTGNSLCLPLFAEHGNALADYILHGRPNSNSEEYIFLKIVAPHSKLIGSSSGDSILKRCYESNPSLADKCTGKSFHSFRRSLGSWLSMAQTPLPLISEILGHTNLESVKFYLSYDSNHMSMCCLGLDGIPVRKEGLS